MWKSKTNAYFQIYDQILKDDAARLGTKELLIDNYDFYLNQIIAD